MVEGFCYTLMLTGNVVPLPLGQFLPNKEGVNGLKKSRRRYRVSFSLFRNSFLVLLLLNIRNKSNSVFSFSICREKLDILIDDEGKS